VDEPAEELVATEVESFAGVPEVRKWRKGLVLG
jgi:hypothetical protein